MSKALIWFWGWTIAMALALFIPVSNIILTLSVRRLEKKTGTRLNEAEIKGQKKRARIIAAIVSLIFAALFNFNVFGIPNI